MKDSKLEFIKALKRFLNGRDLWDSYVFLFDAEYAEQDNMDEFFENESPSKYIINAFSWTSSERGDRFWDNIDSEWRKVVSGMLDGSLYAFCDDTISSQAMCLRTVGSYRNRGLYLSDKYEWEIVDDGFSKVLIARNK